MKYNLIKKTFIHQNIPYSFNWNRAHYFQKINQINSNKEDFERLKGHFEEVYEGNIPNDLFNSRSIPRISQFKLRGIKSTYLEFFRKKLIRTGKIIELNSQSKLPMRAQRVYETFIGRNMKPGHNPILKNILIKDPDSIAIEVPIWKEYNDTCLTGHIDLIQIEGNTLKVIDYKPEGKFMISLPQVSMYGLIVKNILQWNGTLKCISFNKEEAWEYDPQILLTDIKAFMDSNNLNEREWERFI
ncbi:MAG: hypothetical protein MUP85_21655 [Candidatus Lokiarchaeota archaeon]|nr:hypothetical protein [Candidatus Lokiarchaeota archaeon]